MSMSTLEQYAISILVALTLYSRVSLCPDKGAMAVANNFSG